MEAQPQQRAPSHHPRFSRRTTQGKWPTYAACQLDLSSAEAKGTVLGLACFLVNIYQQSYEKHTHFTNEEPNLREVKHQAQTTD